MNMKIIKVHLLFLVIAASFLMLDSLASIQKSQPAQKKSPSMSMLAVDIPDFPAEGLILDIGGGGEGIIGQLKKTQVVAVDINKRELVDAPAGPLLKIVMDGRDLKFLDETFPTATVFFTFMYISSTDHEKVFAEIHRVLKPGGRLLIWDVIFPKQVDDIKERALFMLKITLPEKVINTGYGVRYPEDEQGILHYKELAEKSGFEILSESDDGKWFYLELKKSGA